MGTLTRTTEMDADPGAWADGKPAERPHDDYTDSDGEAALELLADALVALDSATRGADYTVTDATRWLTEHGEVTSLVDTVALIQSLKRRLGLLEAHLSTAAGQLANEWPAKKAGDTTGGWPYEILKSTERKAWDHEGWKASARMAVVSRVLDGRIGGQPLPSMLIDPDTGEAVETATILTAAVRATQEVHGSTAPRATQLRALGIAANDYCESKPGPWRVKVGHGDDD